MLGKQRADKPADSLSLYRHRESTLSGTVIFPITEAQRNGLEDLRLVEFTRDSGKSEWIGTYTAYSGRDSHNDHYMGLREARRLSRIWGSSFADAGHAGHINADSGLGDWYFGQFLLGQLIRHAQRKAPAGLSTSRAAVHQSEPLSELRL